jgi:hypothetical protein
LKTRNIYDVLLKNRTLVEIIFVTNKRSVFGNTLNNLKKRKDTV